MSQKVQPSSRNHFGFSLGAALLLLIPALAAFAQQPAGNTFAAPGATIYYEVRGAGSGTPLVVVNGGPGFDHSYMLVSTAAWDAIARGRRIVFYDQRGTGRSSATGKDPSYALADQMNDLDALRTHLGLERMDLLGHSWGGFLAMAYAARFPRHIAHLVIVDSGAPKIDDTLFLFKDVFPETTERQKSFDFADALGDKDATIANLREYLTMLFYAPEHRDIFLSRFSPSGYNKTVNEATWKDASRFDLNPELRKFRFPVLVITGRYDMNVAPSVAYKIHQAIPGSRFLVFERSGHLPFLEEPEGFAHAVEDFLNSK